jgi:hypothetical protein
MRASERSSSRASSYRCLRARYLRSLYRASSSFKTNSPRPINSRSCTHSHRVSHSRQLAGHARVHLVRIRLVAMLGERRPAFVPKVLKPERILATHKQQLRAHHARTSEQEDTTTLIVIASWSLSSSSLSLVIGHHHHHLHHHRIIIIISIIIIIIIESSNHRIIIIESSSSLHINVIHASTHITIELPCRAHAACRSRQGRQVDDWRRGVVVVSLRSPVSDAGGQAVHTWRRILRHRRTGADDEEGSESD